MMRNPLWLIVLIGAAASAFAEPKIEGTPGELEAYLAGRPRTVFVAGDAEVKAPADRAIMKLRVTTENKSLDHAMTENTSIRAQVETKLREQGIPAENIQSAKLSSTPQTWIFSDKTKSYKIEHVIRVRVEDEKQMREVAALLDSFSPLTFEGISFEHSKKKELERQALAEACADAAQKKKIYEDGLGVSLKTIRFVENAENMPDYMPRQAFAKGEYPSARSPVAPAALMIPDSSTGFEEMVFRGSITVEYQVGPK